MLLEKQLIITNCYRYYTQNLKITKCIANYIVGVFSLGLFMFCFWIAILWKLVLELLKLTYRGKLDKHTHYLWFIYVSVYAVWIYMML